MALGIRFDIEQNPGCGSIDFIDTTGVYDPITNPFGYGTGGSGSNPGYDDIGSTKIIFTLSNGQVKTITSFIPTEESPSITLYATDLGYEDVIPDQSVPLVQYIVYDKQGNVLGEKQNPVLFFCQTMNCLIAQKNKILLPSGCANETLDRTTKLVVRFQALLEAFQNNPGCVDGVIEELYIECSKLCNCP